MTASLPDQIANFAVEAASDAAFWVDGGGRVMYVNQAACASLLRAREELLSLNFHDLDPTFPLEAAGDAGRRLRPEPYTVESHLRRADGSSFPVELSIIPFRHQGQPFHWVMAREITKRKQTEAALRESQERFRRAFEDAAVGMAIFSPGGRLLQANTFLCRMLGYTEDELKELSFIGVTHPDDRAATIESDKRMLRGEMHWAWLEKRYLKKDGRSVWVILSSSLIRDRTGRPRYFLSHIQDISERKRVTGALMESRELFRSAFEDAAVGMVIFTADGHIEQVNSFMCRKLGYTEEELKGKHYLDITHPDDFEISTGSDRVVISREKPFVSYEKRYLRKDGGPVWFIASNSLLRDTEGRPTYFVAHFQDITQRKEAERALKETERRFSLFMANMPGRAFIKDPEGRYLYANRLVRGSDPDFAREEVIGLRDRDIHPEKTAEEQRTNDLKVLRSGRPTEFMEVLPGRQGDRHWLTYKFPVLQDDGSTLLGGVAIDITARVESARELEIKDRELELQAEHLERINTALKVLLDHREQEKVQQEKAMLATLEKLVSPYLGRALEGRIDPDSRTYLDIAASNLAKIAEPFASQLSSADTGLTPAELKVADLLRHGKTSDQIADLLHLSVHTVARHRASIRSKLGLTGRRVNLRAFLQSQS